MNEGVCTQIAYYSFILTSDVKEEFILAISIQGLGKKQMQKRV